MKFAIVYSQLDLEDVNINGYPDIGIYDNKLFDSRDEARKYIEEKIVEDYHATGDEIGEGLIFDKYGNTDEDEFFTLEFTATEDGDYVTNSTTLKIIPIEN